MNAFKNCNYLISPFFKKRIQGSVLMTDSKRKNMLSSRFKSEQIRKNEQLKIKNGETYFEYFFIPLSSLLKQN